MSSFRSRLKTCIPRSLWPVMGWVDGRIVSLFYVASWLRRKLYFPELPVSFVSNDDDRILTLNVTEKVNISDPEQISQQLLEIGIQTFEGRHSVYIGDMKDIQAILPGLEGRFPEPYGVKIIRSTEISADGTPFYTSCKLAPASTWFSMQAVGSIAEKMVVSNLLSNYRLAPRCYEIIRIRCGACTYYAMVVQHVSGSPLHGTLAHEFMKNFLKRCQELSIHPVSISDHKDLRPPAYNDNIIADDSSLDSARYVDVQNFTVAGKKWLEELLHQAASALLQHGQACKDAQHERLDKQSATIQKIFLALAGVFPLNLCLEFMNLRGVNYTILVEPECDAGLMQKCLYLAGYGNFTIIHGEGDKLLGAKALSAADRVIFDTHHSQYFLLADYARTSHHSGVRDGQNIQREN